MPQLAKYPLGSGNKRRDVGSTNQLHAPQDDVCMVRKAGGETIWGCVSQILMLINWRCVEPSLSEGLGTRQPRT
eukprot:6075447-Amphidinium_carterae.1